MKKFFKKISEKVNGAIISAKTALANKNGEAFPCARRYGDGTAKEVERVGNITAVEAGDEKVRSTPPEGMERTDNIMSRVVRRVQK